MKKNVILCQSLFFNKAAGLWIFSCEFYKIYQNTFSYRRSPVAASESSFSGRNNFWLRLRRFNHRPETINLSLRFLSPEITLFSFSLSVCFFFYLGFVSRTFTNHRTAREGGGHCIDSWLSLPPASRALRH